MPVRHRASIHLKWIAVVSINAINWKMRWFSAIFSIRPTRKCDSRIQGLSQRFNGHFLIQNFIEIVLGRKMIEFGKKTFRFRKLKGANEIKAKCLLVLQLYLFEWKLERSHWPVSISLNDVFFPNWFKVFCNNFLEHYL